VQLTDTMFQDLLRVRVEAPQRIATAYQGRRRRQSLTRDGKMFIIAADHSARGMLALGADKTAMANRRSMLQRILTALENPRVDGVLGSADILDDLVLLGALEDKVAVGTMNRGGLQGARWELDDRFTAYDTQHIVASRLDAGKVLLRIDDRDDGTVPTLYNCAQAVQELNDHQLIAMIEPIPYTKNADGQAIWDNDPLKLLRAVAVSAALGSSSAYTWLKIQATADIKMVAATTNQPLLLLGGAPGPDPAETFATWEKALAEPTVRGLVAGRALLYPPGDDVAGAVARAAALVDQAAR
jgi:hypothetical protein